MNKEISNDNMERFIGIYYNEYDPVYDKLSRCYVQYFGNWIAASINPETRKLKIYKTDDGVDSYDLDVIDNFIIGQDLLKLYL